MLGKPLRDPVGNESLNAESYVRPKSCGPASLHQCDELRSGTDAEDRNWRTLIAGCPPPSGLHLVGLPPHVGQLQIPIHRPLDIRHDQLYVVQRQDWNRRGVTGTPRRLGGAVADVPQEPASA